MRKQLDTLRGIASILTNQGVRYWLIGGWAVDHHAGRVTRAHRDIDFAVLLEDRESVWFVLKQKGFARVGDASNATELFRNGAVDVELTYLVERDGTFVTPGFEHWPWLTWTFGPDRASLDGVEVPVASIAGLLDTERGWQREIGEPLRDHDKADIAELEALKTHDG